MERTEKLKQTYIQAPFDPVHSKTSATRMEQRNSHIHIPEEETQFIDYLKALDLEVRCLENGHFLRS